MVFRAGQPGDLSVSGGTLLMEVASRDNLPFQAIAARPEAGGYASGPPRRHWFSRPRSDGVRSHRLRAFRRHRVKLARPDTSRWCSVDDIQDTGGRTSGSDSHHGAGATCLLYPQAGQVAAVGNHAVRDTGADPQHGLPCKVDLASRRTRRGVPGRSRSQYAYGLRSQLRKHREDAAVSLRQGRVRLAGSCGCTASDSGHPGADTSGSGAERSAAGCKISDRYAATGGRGQTSQYGWKPQLDHYWVKGSATTVPSPS